jgi:hypothetical protein
MQQVELAAAQCLLSIYSSPCLPKNSFTTTDSGTIASSTILSSALSFFTIVRCTVQSFPPYFSAVSTACSILPTLLSLGPHPILSSTLSPKVYLGSGVQLYSLAETPKLSPSPRIWAHIYEGAIAGQPRSTTSLCNTLLSPVRMFPARCLHRVFLRLFLQC